MAHSLSPDTGSVEELVPPGAAEDPLEVQTLWPITTDLVDAAARVTKAIHDIAHALADDSDSASVALRQHLLEIRAQLVYAYSEIRSTIIPDTRELFIRTVSAAGATLRNDPPSSSRTAQFERIVAAILSACYTSRILLEETREAWGAFYILLSQFYSSRAGSSQSGVAAFLRSFGAFASQAPSPQGNVQRSQSSIVGEGTGQDLQSMIQSLERIEAFWRKREGLFSGSGYTFGRDELARFYQSYQQLGDAYLHFMDPLVQSEQDLSYPLPPVLHTPRSISKSAKSELSWRALLLP